MSSLRRLLTAAVGHDVVRTGRPHHLDRPRSQRRDRSTGRVAHDLATARAQHDRLSTLLSLR